MALISCTECKEQISENAVTCPKCGQPLNLWRGYEWRTKVEFLGLPLVHIAFGRDKKTGKLLVAKGIIAIGQFAIGVIAIAQFGIGLLFGLGQFMASTIAIGQFAAGILFGLGQFATGATAIGQFALGKYCLAQFGIGEYVWSTKIKDPFAIDYFRSLSGKLGSFKACH